MTKTAINARARRGGILFFLGWLLAPAVYASPLSSQAQSTPVSPQQILPATGALQSTTAAPQTTPPRKITAYTLPPDLYRKAHNRGRIGFAARLVGFFYGLLVLWFILRSRLSAKYRDWAESVSRNRFVQAFIFIPLLVLTIGVLQLPVDIFQEWIAKLYKISVQPWSSWTADWAKAQLLTIVIGSLFAWILYAVIRKSPRRWWLYFWMISLPLLLFGLFISPLVIDPLFNKYEPLASKAPQLVPQLQRVSRRAGQEIPPEQMFWMNASDKTIATNASVNGFGASKRIIIWDTTLAQETTDEVLTDFGHEMGHYVLGHIWKGFLFIAAILFFLLYCGYRTISWLLARYGAAWKVRGLNDWASLPALLLLITLFGFAAGAVGNTFSRYQENQADVYSLEVTHGIVPDPGQAFAHSFQVYGETVLVDPDPNPVNVFLFFDHPTVGDRIHLGVTYDPWSKGETPQFVK
jgi:STE24 endopeptidase